MSDSDINKKIILNLGCGDAKIPESIGVDFAKISDCVDVIHDLNKIPYPFSENSVDEVWLIFTLEHLNEPFLILEEIYRILKPGGKAYIRVPHYSSVYCWGEITHKRAFAYGFWGIFSDSNTRSYYSKARFKVIDARLKYFLTYPPIKWHQADTWKPHWGNYFIVNKFIKLFVLTIQFFIDLSPSFFERFWCYYVGGAAEIAVVLEAKKT